MRRLLIVLTLLLFSIIIVNCNNNKPGIDAPFGLNWNISFNDFANYMKYDTTGIIYNSKAAQEYCKCKNFTKSLLTGMHLGRGRWVDVYFWNDSLFRIEYFVDNSDSSESHIFASLDDIYRMYSDSLNGKNRKIRMKSIDKEISKTKNLILNEYKDYIDREEIDTIYWEMKRYGCIQLKPDEYIQRVTQKIRYIGYDNSKITIEVTKNKDSDSTHQFSGNLIIQVIYSSSNSKHMYDELEKWQNKYGKIYRNRWSSDPSIIQNSQD